MPFTHRSRLADPKLGNYFSIFASAFICLTLLVFIFEKLEFAPWLLSAAMLIFPILGFIVIGAFCFTEDPLDYFATGRRVPAFYSGLNLAFTAIGATGLVSITGIFYMSGFDGLAMFIGGIAGFVVMSILLAPFLRKFGAYTLPSYLGRRFQSRLLRLVVAVIVALPILLTMVAELQIAVLAMGQLVNIPALLSISAVSLVVALTVVAGGQRSVSWSNVAQSIVGLLALMTPVTIVAILLTNVPVPQMSYGPVLREMMRNEPALAVPVIEAGWFGFHYAGNGFEAIQKRFVDAFASIGPIAFFMTTIIFLTGFAGSPWLLPRVSATPGVYEARKSLGWATVIFGIVVLTLIAIAIFVRHYVFEAVLVPQSDGIAPWLQPLVDAGYVKLDSEQSRVLITTLLAKRDTIIWGLPLAAGFPDALWYLAVAGVLAIALAALAATALALGNLISEDFIHGLSWAPIDPKARLLTARICLGVALAIGVLLALVAPADPFTLWMWALSIVGSALFPILVLSIWWKRLTAFGATAGIAAGAGVAIFAILLGETGLTGIDGRISGIFGLPITIATSMVISVMSRAPSRHELELVRDIRVPGGEILYDREMRKQRLRRQQSS